MSPKPLRINIFLGFAGKTGGNVVALEYARRLGEIGHDVRVYYPLLPYAHYYGSYPRWKRWPSRIRTFLSGFRERKRGISWFRAPLDIHPVPLIAWPFVRSADASIATACPTAYDVVGLPASAGTKYYFIQGYEVWNGMVEWVDATYRLPIKLIVIAPWLTELMRSKFHREVDAEIHNGIDLGFYRPPAAKPEGPVSILMLYHHQEIKGIPDGLDVLRRLRKAYPDLIVRMFGMYPFPDKDDFIEYVQDPSPERLRDLYQASHIFLCPSLSEGWHLPPMEAMACGCAVVATNVGCIPALHADGNMLVTEPRDREGLFRLAASLVGDPALLRRVAEAGYRTISGYGWEKPVEKLERILIENAG